MRWDWYHPKVWNFLRRWLWRHCQHCWNHFFKFIFSLFHGLLHDDQIHSSREVHIHILEDGSRIDIAPLFQVSGSSGHMRDSADLLRIQFREFLTGHVINEEVVSDL